MNDKFDYFRNCTKCLPFCFVYTILLFLLNLDISLSMFEFVLFITLTWIFSSPFMSSQNNIILYLRFELLY